MKHMRTISLFILFISFTGCCATLDSGSKKISVDVIDMLYGEITVDDLFKEFPGWKESYNQYKPYKAVLDSISMTPRKIRVEIFLGTWCNDSEREVPRFLKIVDESKFILPDNIKLWAVDRNKSLGSGITQKKSITRVATFIFLVDNEEIGRIIESPKSGRLEEDIWAIVNGNGSWEGN
jgi:hypothetical protein